MVIRYRRLRYGKMRKYNLNRGIVSVCDPNNLMIKLRE